MLVKIEASGHNTWAQPEMRCTVLSVEGRGLAFSYCSSPSPDKPRLRSGQDGLGSFGGKAGMALGGR